MSRNDENHDNSSFLFGMLVGAIIGAIVAIIIYRQHKDEIMKFFKEKFDFYFKAPETSPPPPQKPRVIAARRRPQKTIIPVPQPTLKQEVVLPPEIIAETRANTPPKKIPAKHFIKPKK